MTSPWQPVASREMLVLRAATLEKARRFFAERNVLEVETPVLGLAGSLDPGIESFRATDMTGPRNMRYLHTSPESAMKRLLASGTGSIYQICKVFRAGESGRMHNPEFTMLEWYRTGIDHLQLMNEVAELVCNLLPGCGDPGNFSRYTYAEVFSRYAGIEDVLQADISDLRHAVETHRIDVSGMPDHDRDAWLDLVLSHIIEPHLGTSEPCFIYDYPASQAALARIRPGNPPVAERFELYINGMELANGFHELTDPEEQRQRFDGSLSFLAARGGVEIPRDENLLAALSYGLPESAGVALGFDRLLMLAAGAECIDAVLAFPFDRA